MKQRSIRTSSLRLLCSMCFCSAVLPALAQQSLTVNVNVGGSRTTIASQFMGLSMVLGDAPYIVGTGSAANPYFVRLTRNLTQYSNGPFQVRLLNDGPFPNTITSDILPAWANFYNTMSASSMFGVKYWAGVSLMDNFSWDTSTTPWKPTDTHLASSQASTLSAGLPQGSLLAYEIGNEPDLYSKAPTNDPTNDTNYVRDSSYDFTEYQSEYETVVDDIVALNTGTPMSGPVFGSDSGISSAANLKTFINNESAHLGFLNLHHYAGNHCGGNSVASDFLLSNNAAVNPPQGNATPSNTGTLLAELKAAPASLSNYRVGEMNSVNCHGQDGVSNVFGSALWFLDQAMEYAKTGTPGINLFELDYNDNTVFYSPFKFSQTGTGASEKWAISQINPIYYGMYALANFLQHSAALVPTTPGEIDGYRVKAYATIDNTNTLRVMLINKETTADKDATITLTGISAGNGALCKLLATNNDYKTIEYSGDPNGDYGTITYDGQTFQGSTDGLLQGTATYPAISPTGGNYVVSVPHSSMVVVKIGLP